MTAAHQSLADTLRPAPLTLCPVVRDTAEGDGLDLSGVTAAKAEHIRQGNGDTKPTTYFHIINAAQFRLGFADARQGIYREAHEVAAVLRRQGAVGRFERCESCGYSRGQNFASAYPNLDVAVVWPNGGMASRFATTKLSAVILLGWVL